MSACRYVKAGSNWTMEQATTTLETRDNGHNDGVRAKVKPFTGPVDFSSSGFAQLQAMLVVSRVIKYTSICREWINYINLNHTKHLLPYFLESL